MKPIIPLLIAIALFAFPAAPLRAQEAQPADGEGKEAPAKEFGLGFALDQELDFDLGRQLTSWVTGGGRILLGEDIGGKFWAFTSETGNPFSGGAGWIKQYELGNNFDMNLESSVTNLKAAASAHAVATVDSNGQVRMSAGAKTGFGNGQSTAELGLGTEFMGGDLNASAEIGINHGLFLGAAGDLVWGDGKFGISAEIDFLGLHLGGSFDWDTSKVEVFVNEKILQANEWKDKAWQGIKNLFGGGQDPMNQPTSIMSSMPDPDTEALLDWLQYTYNQPLPQPGSPAPMPPPSLQSAVGPDGSLNIKTPWVESR